MELSEEWNAFEAALGMRPKVVGKDIAEIRTNVAKTRATRPPIPASDSLVISENQTLHDCTSNAIIVLTLLTRRSRPADVKLQNFPVRTYKPKAFAGRLPLGILYVVFNLLPPRCP